MNRVTTALVGALLAVLTVPLAASSAHADCAAPELVVAPTAVLTGGSATVTGRYFAATCNDVWMNGERPPKADPSTVKIRFSQNDRTATLATVTASSKYRIDETVTIPGWADAGDATIDADGALPVEITVVAPANVPEAPLRLASTGADDALPTITLAGLALVAAGALVVRVSRRRGAHRSMTG